MNKIKKISVVGLGKLGSCLAASLAYRGFDVIGFDINNNFVNSINNGITPVDEPRLQELINKSKKRLKATMNPEDIINNSQATFIIVPTPSTKRGDFSDKYIQDSLISLAPFLKNKKEHHIFVITSTVSPGTTEKNLIPLIEKLSGKKLNKDFSVCYNPEFIALGDVVNGLLRPDLVLIGESSKNVGDILEKVYKKFCENNPVIAKMSLVSAEISKIALNSYVTMKISFTNTLGNICEKIPGANVDDVTRALGADKRISPYYLKAGLAYGGLCFPRDNRAFDFFAKNHGIDAKLAKATDRVNEFQIENKFKKIKNILKIHKFNSISILGLAYKIKTPVIEESPAVKLINYILTNHKKTKICIYDPLAIKSAKSVFSRKIYYASSMEKCLNFSPLWVIATPEPEFKNISDKHIKHNPTVIVDSWGIIDESNFKKDIKYIRIGKHNEYN